MKNPFKPDGYNSVSPYFIVDGADRFIQLMKEIFDANILREYRLPDAISGSQPEIASGKLEFRQVAIEHFEPGETDKPFDLAVAIRVGALDGRHPEIEKQALSNIAQALTKNGKLFIDGGNPLKDIPIKDFRKYSAR